MQPQEIKYSPEEYREKLAEAASTCGDGYLLATVYYFFINLRGGETT